MIGELTERIGCSTEYLGRGARRRGRLSHSLTYQMGVGAVCLGGGELNGWEWNTANRRGR